MDAKYLLDQLDKDMFMFSQCPYGPDECPYCYYAKTYIENFLEKNKELMEVNNDRDNRN